MKKAPKIGQVIWYVDMWDMEPGTSRVVKRKVKSIHSPVGIPEPHWKADFLGVDVHNQGRADFIPWDGVFYTEKAAIKEAINNIQKAKLLLSRHIIASKRTWNAFNDKQEKLTARL